MAVRTVTSAADLSDVPVVASQDRPLYVCVAGLTGSGKSTILRRLAALVSEHRTDVALVDEKAIHHPYLHQLFIHPKEFAYELQLHFMVSRALFVKYWLNAGQTLVMERSHLEDLVFIRHLAAFEYVTPEDARIYEDVWSAVASRLPIPDLVLFLNVPAEIAVQRLERDRATDTRPAFGDERTRWAWVSSWYELYQHRFAELRTDPRLEGRLFEISDPVEDDELRNLVDGATRN
jgi:deoxyadenosine/deoxycytidine kinase